MADKKIYFQGGKEKSKERKRLQHKVFKVKVVILAQYILIDNVFVKEKKKQKTMQ